MQHSTCGVLLRDALPPAAVAAHRKQDARQQADLANAANGIAAMSAVVLRAALAAICFAAAALLQTGRAHRHRLARQVASHKLWALLLQ